MASPRESVGLPAFIIIGAMKGGTSSLHHYLSQHPEVCMSAAKEPSYFIEPRNFGKGLDWYRSLFADHGSAARHRPFTARGTGMRVCRKGSGTSFRTSG